MADAVTLKIELPRIPDIELVAIRDLTAGATWGLRMKKRGGQDPHHRGDHQRLRARGNDNNRVDVEFTIDTKGSWSLSGITERDSIPRASRPDIAAKLGTQNKRGWGLKLMKSMSDDFRSNRTSPAPKSPSRSCSADAMDQEFSLTSELNGGVSSLRRPATSIT